MQNKYKLPKDVYQTVIWIIRGQERREQVYKANKDEILNGGGANYIKRYNQSLKSNEYIYLPKGHSNQSSTEIKALALAVLDSTEETKRMKAVINSLNEAASRFYNVDEIKEAIIKNITDRHLYPYRNLGNLYISEKTFYKTKALFIFLVAEKLNYI